MKNSSYFALLCVILVAPRMSQGFAMCLAAVYGAIALAYLVKECR